MEDERKVPLHHFSADWKIASRGKNVFWGIRLHEQQVQVFACCQTHSDHKPSKRPLKLAL